jgi:hypothetical protein
MSEGLNCFLDYFMSLFMSLSVDHTRHLPKRSIRREMKVQC